MDSIDTRSRRATCSAARAVIAVVVGPRYEVTPSGVGSPWRQITTSWRTPTKAMRNGFLHSRQCRATGSNRPTPLVAATSKHRGLSSLARLLAADCGLPALQVSRGK